MTRVGRHDADFAALAADAAWEALAGADASAIEAVFLASFAPRELCGLSDPAGTIASVLAARVPGVRAPLHGPFKTGGEAMFHALEFMRAARGDVLVMGCEKMMHLDAGTAAGLLAPRVSDPVEARHGATLPSLAALATLAYARAQRVPARAFDEVAVKNHAHAALNPLAHFRRAVTVDEVRASPLVADPLRRHHCAPMSDGAAACVLSFGAGAVRVTGWGAGLDAPRFSERARPETFRAAHAAATAAFAMSGRSAREVDVVEIHDAFAPFELMNLEAMGFFEAGDAWRALARGQLSPGGRVAVNPSGGMKARGHPIGVCGLTSMHEVVAQLTGAADARQHPGARVALIQSAGGVAPDCYAFVVEAT
ncbi:MAG TPA: thiolase family protein [Candidatus Krumholzibacteria bacterium]|nr:thiolase family protein [Candidatus Krumholzibacteria bacterium]